jgi:UDP-N-acetylglucosamine 2-epimerase (non-hydrolysing)
LAENLGDKLKKIRVLSIFGTRPEAVKMAPVVHALEAVPEIESRVCVTAQHRQMLDQVLTLFDVRPDVDLNLMRPNQSLAELTAAVMLHLDPVLEKIQPDWILVQGDTTTAMTAALAAFYRHIHIGHVEAGLRTFDRWQPFPEEVNRCMISVVADLNFAPTEHSQKNLLNEGIPPERIVLTGNPVIDALRTIGSHPAPLETVELLEHLDIRPDAKELILVTAHRRENFGEPIENICYALRELAESGQNRLQIVYPVHLNPKIQEPVHRILDGTPNITLLPPLEYLPLVHLMRSAKLVLTDSGGIQEEATALGIPALVLRQTTERPEGVDAGTLKLVGTDASTIYQEARRLLDDPQAYQAMAKAKNPFGDGHASEYIAQALLQYQVTS